MINAKNIDEIDIEAIPVDDYCSDDHGFEESHDDAPETSEELYYEAYAIEHDITFIMRRIIVNNYVDSQECCGWYYGEPSACNTARYKNRLKARFF